MKTHIITIFDKNYLGRALAFRASLEKFSPGQHMHMLCLDEACLETAEKLGLANVTLMRAESLDDPELMKARDDRTLPEFASTCKPAFLLWMMRSGKVAKDDLLVFVDPDFVFYSSPAMLWERMRASGSIIVTPHRFPKEREKDELRNGRYNAGICAFRNDGNALQCLEKWRRQCIAWCYLRYENGMIADQGYMNDWRKRYEGVYELVEPGVNLANWNIANHRIVRRDDGFAVDGSILICYHFHGAKFYRSGNRIKILPILDRHRGIYGTYEALLTDSYRSIGAIAPGWDLGTLSNPGRLRIIKQSIWRMFS